MNLSKHRIPQSITTSRLQLRRHEPTQAQALFEAASTSTQTVYPFLPWCHPDYKIEESIDWLSFATEQWDTGRSYGFGIFDLQTNEFLGGCGLNRFDEHPTMNLGYWIRSSAVGRGYATEATLALARFGFEQLQLIRIEIIMSVRNEASRRVAEGAGGQYEGRLKNRLMLHGEAHDAHLFALTV